MRFVRLTGSTLLFLFQFCLHNPLGFSMAVAEEAPLLLWENSFDSYPELGGDGYDVMLDVAVLDDGGAVAAGYAIPLGSHTPGGKPQQAFLVRLDAFGTEMWRTYLGESNDNDYEAVRVRQAIDGGFVVACTAFTPFPLGSLGIYYGTSFVAKLDGAGIEQWRYRFDPLLLDEIGDLDVIPDGSIVAVGRVWNTGGGTSTAVAKLSPAGSLLWLRKELPDHIQSVGKIAATLDGGLYATTESGLLQTLSHYGPDGAHLWSVPIQGLDGDRYLAEKDIHGITVEDRRGCIVAGATRYNNGATYGPFRPFLAAFDERGHQNNTLVIPTNSKWVDAVVRLADGGIIAAEGVEGSDSAPVFVRYNRLGNESWRSDFGVPAAERYISSIRVSGDGIAVAAGAIRGLGSWSPLDAYVLMVRGITTDQISAKGKSRIQLACEKTCHADHREWVDLCVANHNPREILPSARGQCVTTGAGRLQQCLDRCR